MQIIWNSQELIHNYIFLIKKRLSLWMTQSSLIHVIINDLIFPNSLSYENVLVLNTLLKKSEIWWSIQTWHNIASLLIKLRTELKLIFFSRYSCTRSITRWKEKLTSSWTCLPATWRCRMEVPTRCRHR